MEEQQADPVVSVCIVTGRRIPLLDACLASLADQQDPPPFEVLVVSDGDREVEAAVRRRFPHAHVATVVRALPGAARNVLLDVARGELLLFLDDDVTCEPHVLRRLADVAAAHPEAAVIGGPNDTPPGSSRFQLVQGAVLASFVGAGPVRRRYGPHPAGPADERFFILCNLAVRREAMRPFDRSLICAEENELLAALSDEGVAMHYDPELVVFHERRGTWRGFVQQMHKYGRGRGEVVTRRPATVRPAFLAPTAFVGYLAALPLLGRLVGVRALLPLGAYGAAVVANSVRIGATLRDPSAVTRAAGMIVALHLAYGTGVARGVLRPSPPAEEPVTVPVVARPVVPEPAPALSDEPGAAVAGTVAVPALAGTAVDGDRPTAPFDPVGATAVAAP